MGRADGERYDWTRPGLEAHAEVSRASVCSTATDTSEGTAGPCRRARAEHLSQARRPDSYAPPSWPSSRARIAVPRSASRAQLSYNRVPRKAVNDCAGMRYTTRLSEKRCRMALDEAVKRHRHLASGRMGVPPPRPAQAVANAGDLALLCRPTDEALSTAEARF